MDTTPASTAPDDVAPVSDQRRLVVMDVDSTVITAEVIELLAERAGTRALVAAVTERAMRGEIDFATSLHERVATLAGLPETVFAEVAAEVQLSPGAAELVAELHRRDWPVALVSGGFTQVVTSIASRLGISRFLANTLEVVDGQLTGRVIGAVVDRAAKAAALIQFAAKEGIPLSRTIAIGDGANDLDMMATAAFSVAFNAKPVVAAAADAAITGRLDVILERPELAMHDAGEARAQQ